MAHTYSVNTTPEMTEEERWEIYDREFKDANLCAGFLMQQGFTVFSPISMSHPIAKTCTLPRDWAFWEKIDRDFLSVSKVLIVCITPGWDRSTGITAEIEIAKELNLQIFYMTRQDTHTFQLFFDPELRLLALSQELINWVKSEL